MTFQDKRNLIDEILQKLRDLNIKTTAEVVSETIDEIVEETGQTWYLDDSFFNESAEWLTGYMFKLLNVDAPAALPTDLITQAEAAKMLPVLSGGQLKQRVQTIRQAIDTNRLTGYTIPDAEHQRQGKTLVSRADIERLWGKK
jgi:hypothetical protein